MVRTVTRVANCSDLINRERPSPPNAGLQVPARVFVGGHGEGEWEGEGEGVLEGRGGGGAEEVARGAVEVVEVAEVVDVVDVRAGRRTGVRSVGKKGEEGGGDVGCGCGCEGEEEDCTEWRGDGGGCECGCEFDMKEWGEGEDMDWGVGEDEDWGEGGDGYWCESEEEDWGEGEDEEWRGYEGEELSESEVEEWSEREEEDCRGGRRGQGVRGEGGGRKEGVGVGEKWELDQKRPRSYLKATELVRRPVCFPPVVVPRRGELARDPSERGRAWTFTYEGPKRTNDPEEVKLDDTPPDFGLIFFGMRGSSVRTPPPPPVRGGGRCPKREIRGMGRGRKYEGVRRAATGKGRTRGRKRGCARRSKHGSRKAADRGSLSNVWPKEPRTGHVVARGRTRVQNVLTGLGEVGLERGGGGEWVTHPEREAGRVVSGGGRSSGRPRRRPEEKMGLGCIVNQGFKIGRHVRASGPGAGNCPFHFLSCSHGVSICRALAAAPPPDRWGWSWPSCIGNMFGDLGSKECGRCNGHAQPRPHCCSQSLISTAKWLNRSSRQHNAVQQALLLWERWAAGGGLVDRGDTYSRRFFFCKIFRDLFLPPFGGAPIQWLTCLVEGLNRRYYHHHHRGAVFIGSWGAVFIGSWGAVFIGSWGAVFRARGGLCLWLVGGCV